MEDNPQSNKRRSAPETTEVRTFLIADVRGYTRFTIEHGDEAAAKLTRHFAVVANDVIQEKSGRVVEVRGDEVLAVFESARQGLRAAVALQMRIAQEKNVPAPFAVGIGLDAGEAIGVDGGFRGAALNLAARLCSQAAEGEILVSGAVAHLARKVEGLEYRDRGMLELKGFDEPVRVFAVQAAARPGSLTDDELSAAQVGRKKSDVIEQPLQDLPTGGYLGALPLTPLVAREAEVGRMLSVVDLVDQGSGRLLLLAGEPGAGKTRLAQEITLQVRDRGFTIAAGRCYEPQAAVPFYPFLDVLTSAYATVSPSVRSTIPNRWPGLVQLLPSLGMPHSDYASPPDQQRLFWAVTDFLRRVAEERPLAILLDDVHWADAASIDLLQHLARHTRKDRILLLATYRDVEVGRTHPLEAALRDLEREGIVERQVVHRLAHDGTAALIASTMGETKVSRGLIDLVYGRTEGNPFFVQQVVRMLVERGDINRQGGEWNGLEEDLIDVPDTVRSVIDQRLSRLADDTQEVLQEASVLGQTFSFEDLMDMTGRDERKLERAIDDVMVIGLVREVGRDAYGFDHALTQQSLYSQISSRRRRRLHHAAAEAIQRLSVEKQNARAAELARHCLVGGDIEHALHFLIVAGDQAVKVFAHEDAATHYNAARDLAEQLHNQEQEAAVRERLGGLLTAVIRYDEALPMLERAAQMYRAAGDLESEARVLAQVGRVHVAGGSVERGVSILQSALNSHSHYELHSSQAALYSSLSRLLYVGGRYGESLDSAAEAIRLARDGGAVGIVAEAEVTRAAALPMLGDWSDGVATARVAIAHAEEAGDVFSACRGCLYLSGMLLARGEWEPAHRCLAAALAHAERMSNPRQIANALLGLGVHAFLIGQIDRSREYAERAQEIMRQLGGFWFRVLDSAGISLVLSAREWDLMPRALKDCISLSEGSSERALLRVARLDAERALEEGRPEAARDLLKSARSSHALEAEQAHALAPLAAHIHLECGDERSAQEELQIVSLIVSVQGLRVLECDLARVRAIIEFRLRQWTSAEATLRRGIETAEQLQYAYAEARLRSLYGRLLAEQDQPESGSNELSHALLLFDRLGATRDVTDTEKTLAEIVRC
ncbi:MAG TPA: AAA family ATPase [Chloroflexota bacterium]